MCMFLYTWVFECAEIPVEVLDKTNSCDLKCVAHWSQKLWMCLYSVCYSFIYVNKGENKWFWRFPSSKMVKRSALEQFFKLMCVCVCLRLINLITKINLIFSFYALYLIAIYRSAWLLGSLLLHFCLPVPFKPDFSSINILHCTIDLLCGQPGP